MFKKHIKMLIAVIGCVTGILALSWQIWDSYRPPKDQVLLLPRGFIMSLNRHDAGSIRFLITICNIGEKDIYISEIGLMSDFGRDPGKYWDIYVVGLIHKELTLPIKPGEQRNILFPICAQYEYKDFLIYYKNYFFQVKTTRGTIVTYKDFYNDYLQYYLHELIDIKKPTSKKGVQQGSPSAYR